MENYLTEEEWLKYNILKKKTFMNYLAYNGLTEENKKLLKKGDKILFNEYLDILNRNER